MERIILRYIRVRVLGALQICWRSNEFEIIAGNILSTSTRNFVVDKRQMLDICDETERAPSNTRLSVLKDYTGVEGSLGVHMAQQTHTT